MECVFCEIVSGERKAHIVYEDELVMAFLDINPANRGHTLIIPKKHYENIFDIDEELASYIFKKAVYLGRVIKEAVGCEGINLVSSSGRAALQTIMHFHIHIIPRWKDDKIIKPWQPKRLKEEEFEEIAETIKSKLS